MNTDTETLLNQEVIYSDSNDYPSPYKVSTYRGLIRVLKSKLFNQGKKLNPSRIGFGWNLSPKEVAVFNCEIGLDHKLIFSDPFFYPDLYKRYGAEVKKRRDGWGGWSMKYIQEILDAMDR